jgi:hypothetical protein
MAGAEPRRSKVTEDTEGTVLHGATGKRRRTEAVRTAAEGGSRVTEGAAHKPRTKLGRLIRAAFRRPRAASSAGCRLNGSAIRDLRISVLHWSSSCVFYVAGRCQGSLRSASLRTSSQTMPMRLHAGPGSARVDDPGLAFYPSARDLARLPETVQSRSRTRGCGPFSVAVRQRRNPTNTGRAARVPRGDSRDRADATLRIAPSGTTPVVTYRQRVITNLRATATMPIRRARFPFAKCA